MTKKKKKEEPSIPRSVWRVGGGPPLRVSATSPLPSLSLFDLSQQQKIRTRNLSFKNHVCVCEGEG